MEMDVGVKYRTTYLGILDLPRGKSDTGNNFLKVLDDKIGPVIRYLDNESTKTN